MNVWGDGGGGASIEETALVGHLEANQAHCMAKLLDHVRETRSGIRPERFRCSGLAGGRREGNVHHSLSTGRSRRNVEDRRAGWTVGGVVASKKNLYRVFTLAGHEVEVTATAASVAIPAPDIPTS